MMMQTGKYWVSDNIYLFLSNSPMWSLFVTVSEFYQGKVMFGFVCYSVKNRGKQPIFLTVVFKMAG